MSSQTNFPSIATGTWTGSANVFATDAVYASKTGSGLTGAIVATGFGFTIPDGSSIDGIVLDVVRHGDGTPIHDFEVKLYNGAAVGTDKADTVTDWGPVTPDETKSYGGSSDTWGRSWAVSEINASSFGVSYNVNMGSPDVGPAIDSFRITVFYTVGGGAGGGSMASVVVVAVRPTGAPGRVAASGPGQPFVLPPGSGVLVAHAYAPAAQPGFAGAVFAGMNRGPAAIPAGSILPLSPVTVEIARPGFAGGVMTSRGTAQPQPSQQIPPVAMARDQMWPAPAGRADGSGRRAEPTIPFRPIVKLPVREADRAGPPGVVRVASSRWPMVPPMPPPKVAREVARAGAPGSARYFFLPPPPTVRIPTGSRVVIRDLERGSPPGSVFTRISPPENFPAPSPRVAARLVDREPWTLAGRVRAGSTTGPPQPHPTPAALVELVTTLRPPGGAAFSFRPRAAAEPAGALIPRSVIVRELARAGFAGRVVSFHGAHDFELPILTPIFESSGPPSYRSRAADNFNSGGPETFRARRVP